MIIKGYKEEDIYNTDETGLLFKTCSKKSLMFQGDTAYGSKKFKDRVTSPYLLMVWRKDEAYPDRQEREAEGSEGCGYEEDSGPLSIAEIFMDD